MASSIIGPLSNLINNDYALGQANNPAAQITVPTREEKPPIVENPGETTKKSAGRRSSPAECETCKHRKYQDGSNENDVSFQTAAHISPESAGSRVRAHEQEHVSNAYSKAAQNNGKVISAVVAIHTAVCPECGRTYVSGGTTTTKIKYSKDDTAYGKGINFANADAFNGQNVDIKG